MIEPPPAAGRGPNDLQAGLELGYALHVRGALHEAAALYRHLLEAFPESDELCLRLGNIERSRGNFGGAIDLFRRAIALRPTSWQARSNLGLTLEELGRSPEAAAVLSDALAVDPNRAEVHYNLAISLSSLGRLEEAAACYRRAGELQPDFAEAHNNLGATLKVIGRLDEAIAAFRAALRVRPDWALVHSNLAGLYDWQARHDDALAAHRRAVALVPDDPGTHGNILFTMLFHPGCDAAAQLAEHREWSRRHAEPLRRFVRPHTNDRSPERRLRVGYVSGLFRDHVLGRYLAPLFRAHDRSDVEVVCYSSNRIDDAMTGWFRQHAAGWRDIRSLPDVDAAELIRRDGIDVLVNTSLHMETSNVLLFAHKPAPVQVAFAGYPGTTGLDAIDYRFTDVHLEPPGEEGPSGPESPWRLASFWCYDPVGASVAPAPPPSESAGHITFGCLNNFSKINDRVLELWARVLAAAPSSRLLVLCHEGSHRAAALEALKWRGVDPARVEFVGYRPRSEYLALFNRIDVSLDTFPYNGHTTSLDSLWMGVPVVTLVGNTVVGRAGLSQLTNLGLPELVARRADDYVSIATSLATDGARLREMRSSLRSRMERSPLMDASAFARGIEAAYRAMWRRYCAGAPPVQGP